MGPLLLGILILYQGIGGGGCFLFGITEGIIDSVIEPVKEVLELGTNYIAGAVRRPIEGGWPWYDSTLGYLYVNDSWYDTKYRPFNLVPYSRYSINTQFFIHTRRSRNEDSNHQVIAYQAYTFDGTGFDPIKPTKFFIHGYIVDGHHKLAKKFVRELLDYGEYNVFNVNWGDGSRDSYSQCVGNTRVVGLEIAYLVNWMIAYYSLDPAHVHLIGHSLGAHVAGYAGESIPGLGRISGLDPAGPYFTAMPWFVRLDKTDAVFVDNYHTNAAESTLVAVDSLINGYGTWQAMGHVDFYPNGGEQQPGCVTTNICSHKAAIHLYLKTLKERCPYIARQCDYYSFINNKCGSCDIAHRYYSWYCAPFGIIASEYEFKWRVNVKMYLNTNVDVPDSPYCDFSKKKS